ncbi:MAG: hypothetical protein AVO34_02150 [Firmicutes bacterium ML8_F2]|jgi:hypothetical protein|nr:MAG: hypothetical protein AVO34_02150 [Firmicutes bacterium ML8_F2]
MIADLKRIVNPNAKKLQRWAGDNESDIILTIGIILIALISFGAGRLTALQADIKPIVIQNPSASVIQASKFDSGENATEDTTKEQGKLVGSVNSSKYHWPECPWAKKIAPQNQIWFDSEAEAQTAGYAPCGNFEKYRPNN